MESLDRSKEIIDLGKRIVVGLQLGDDLTAQWMAHLVAEKISAAEHASDDTRDAAVADCVEVIQKLWANRYTLPPYMRPLRELDPLLRTLKSLSVDEADGPSRFFSHAPRDEELEGASEEEKKLFEFAIGIDHSARELIRYLLSAAAEQSTDAVSPWLNEAVKGGLDVKVELMVSRFVADGLLTKAKEEAQQRAVRNRIEKLESFASAALALAGEMRKMLPPGVDASEG
jgi:hypothetical protein